MKFVLALVVAALLAPFGLAAGTTGPIAKAGPARSVGVGESVLFDGSASTPGANASLVSYSWNFDDGGKAIGVRANHSFAKPGVYNVTLATIDSKAGAASAVVPILVRANATAANATKQMTNASTNATKPLAPPPPNKSGAGPAKLPTPAKPPAVPTSAKANTTGASHRTVPGGTFALGVLAVSAAALLVARRRQ